MSSLYPLWVEKMVFIGLISLAIVSGIALKSHLEGPALILSWVCGLPLLVLVLTEGIGRVVQSVYSK